MLYLFIFIQSLILSMLLIPLLVRFAANFHLVDEPDERKVHAVAIPRIGGIAIGIGFIIPLLLWLSFSQQAVGLIVGGLIIHLFGLWDDVACLNYKIKFFGQLLGITFAILYGDIMIYYVPFSLIPIPVYLAFPLTLFFLLGVTNAINLSDGLDGLAGGVTFLSFSILLLLAYESGDTSLTMMIVALSGALLGFLRFNTRPARLFMGDSGSQLLGFMLASFIIILLQDSNRALSPVIGFLILGLPILDTLFVMVQRLKEGRSPFSPDMNHIHHKLMSLGMNHHESVVTIYFAQAIFVVSAILLRYQSDSLIMALYLTGCTVIFYLLRTGERLGWKKHGGRSIPGLSRFIAIVIERRLNTLLPLAFLSVAIPLYMVVGSVWVDSVPRDFALISAVLFIILIMKMIFGETGSSMLLRSIIYTVSIFIVYLVAQEPSFENNVARMMHVLLFFCLAIAVALVVRFDSAMPFTATSMDYMVVFIVLGISIMPKGIIIEYNISLMVVKSVIILYGCEVLINRHTTRLTVLNISVAVTLAVLSLRGLLTMA